MSAHTLTAFANRIRCCPRCGGAHEKVAFQPFRNPPPDSDLWGTCPTTGEPILIVTSEEVRNPLVQGEITMSGKYTLDELRAVVAQVEAQYAKANAPRTNKDIR